MDQDINAPQFNCPQFIELDMAHVADDSWFRRQGTASADKFLVTIDLNKKEDESQKRRGDGSYSEIAAYNECKSSSRKSHSMKTRQDPRISKGCEDEEPEATSHGDELKKTKKKPLLAKKRNEPQTSSSGEPYETMAQKLVKFFHKTPERFRNAKKGQPATGRPYSIPNTHPVTPHLATKRRIRGIGNVKSAQERENEEIEAMKAAQFKAHPVNPRVLGRSVSCNEADGRPHRSKKEIAKSVVARLAKPKDRDNSLEPYEKPTNKMLKRTCSTRTVPHSPALQTKKRAIAHPEPVAIPEESAPVESFYHPIPDFKNKFQPKLEHKATKPEPFSFANRDRCKFELKEAKIRDILEKEKQMATAFRAQPLPSDSPDDLPEKKTRAPTRPDEFVFHSDARAATYVNKHKDREQQESEQREMTRFKARPAEVLKKPPFEPVVPSRVIENCDPPVLATEARAQSWRSLEAQMAAREKLVESEKIRETEEREKREILAEVKQRTKAVHKAQPVRQFKPVEIRPSDKTLTVPHSPNFSKRFKK